MARTGFFETIFQGMTRSEAMMLGAWVKTLELQEEEEREDAGRLLAWYNRDAVAIERRLKELARKTFGDECDNWQWPRANGVPRIIRRISLSYMSPPERKVVRNGEPLDAKSTDHQLVFGPAGLYSGIDINRKMKEADRFSGLLNTVHIEVVPRHGKIDWDFRLRPCTMVVPDPDDYLHFVKFAYEFNPMNPDTLQARVGWVYWTKENHFYLMGDGELVGVSLDDGSNPYAGEIPIVTVRKLEQDDYWGHFGADLVDGFEQATLQLANMWENGFMQTHGQPFGVNLGLKKGETLITGPKNPITVDNVGKDDVPPDLRFVKPDADITIVRDLVEWFMNINGQAYGLPEGSWTAQAASPESGFARFIKNLELFEDRDDVQDMWIKVEQELFEKSRMVWNRWAMENKVKPIPEDLELQVAFQPVKMAEDPTEKIARYTAATKLGVSSPVRYFMEEEGLDEEAAKAKVEKIAEENKLGAPAPAADFMSQFLKGQPNQPAKGVVPPQLEASAIAAGNANQPGGGK
jgi:hypothetical protein